MEHQQGRAHLGDSSAWPEAARVGAATRTVARRPADDGGDGCRWLRDREGGVQEAARSGEVESEVRWDGGGSKDERGWRPRSLTCRQWRPAPRVRGGLR